MRFNSQPPEGGWRTVLFSQVPALQVSTHSRPKAAGSSSTSQVINGLFQLTAARRRLVLCNAGASLYSCVSTHSRPKAAGAPRKASHEPPACFNSQPPEGGWSINRRQPNAICCFNSQPPEGGWLNGLGVFVRVKRFQLTAARRRLAVTRFPVGKPASFQLTAARRRLG